MSTRRNRQRFRKMFCQSNFSSTKIGGELGCVVFQQSKLRSTIFRRDKIRTFKQTNQSNRIKPKKKISFISCILSYWQPTISISKIQFN
jgi:hypothetical protein